MLEATEMPKTTAQELEEKTLEEYISYGLELREKKDNITWDLGDLAIDITNHFGPSYLTDFSKSIGLNVSTMRRYRDVSKCYNKEEREEYSVLSWTHFRLVAARENRMELLQIAADREWSVEKLSQYLTELDLADKNDDEAFGPDDMDNGIPAMPEVKYCEVCKGWYIADYNKVCINNGTCHE